MQKGMINPLHNMALKSATCVFLQNYQEIAQLKFTCFNFL